MTAKKRTDFETAVRDLLHEELKEILMKAQRYDDLKTLAEMGTMSPLLNIFQDNRWLSERGHKKVCGYELDTMLSGPSCTLKKGHEGHHSAMYKGNRRNWY